MKREYLDAWIGFKLRIVTMLNEKLTAGGKVKQHTLVPICRKHAGWGFLCVANQTELLFQSDEPETHGCVKLH